MTVSAPNTVGKPTNTVFLKAQALKSFGFGWEDIAVRLRADGHKVSNSEIRRFVLGNHDGPAQGLLKRGR